LDAIKTLGSKKAFSKLIALAYFLRCFVPQHDKGGMHSKNQMLKLKLVLSALMKSAWLIGSRMQGTTHCSLFAIELYWADCKSDLAGIRHGECGIAE
jgi:hypothetical protein